MSRARRLAVALSVSLLAVAPAMAAGPDHSVFTTLGTASGPVPQRMRAQPANLLRFGDQLVMIDVGDGADAQAGRAGVPLGDIQTLIISHLHFDHTGGLFALLGQRYQVITPGVLTIYGPPGTKVLVDGLLAAMQAFPASGPRFAAGPEKSVKVIEVNDGSRFTLGRIAVTAASNSHYSYPPGSPEATKNVSLAFRFDMPDRSIVYTGDTGASVNVETLARGADLLVTEINDPEVALAMLRKSRPDLPAPIMAQVEQHFRKEHLSADDVGAMAAHAGVKALVVTHNALADDALRPAKARIAKAYKGPVTFARDLDSF